MLHTIQDSFSLSFAISKPKSYSDVNIPTWCVANITKLSC